MTTTAAWRLPAHFPARFRALHAPGKLLVLPNVWDAASARLVELAGAPALATSSAAVAWAHGLPDGQRLSMVQLLASTETILRAVRIPVSIDLERGYAPSAEGVAETACLLAEAGVAGINLEDGVEAPELLALKLQSSRRALQREGLDLFLNARIDVVLRRMYTGPRAHEEIVRRARLYADAGCDGVFVPGTLTPDLLGSLAAAVPVPLNIWASEQLPGPEQLRALGVRRVSVGPRLALTAIAAARHEAEQLLAGHWAPTSNTPVPTPFEVNGWFR